MRPCARLASFVAVPLAGMLALAAPPAHAFRLTGPAGGPGSNAYSEHWPQEWSPFLHWDLREFSNCQVPYAIKPGTADIGGDSALVAIRAAAASWSQVTPALLTLSEKAPPATGCPGKMDGHNLIGWSSAPDCAVIGDDVWLIPAAACGDNVGLNTPIIGAGPDGVLTTIVNNCGLNENEYSAGGNIIRTTGISPLVQTLPNQFPAGLFGLTVMFADNATGRILEADIVLNDALKWHIAGHDVPAEGIPDVQTIVLHELGHLLGIAHSSDGSGNPPGPVMNATFNVNGHTNHVLANDDKDACNFLYNPDLGDAPDPFKGVDGEFPSIVRRGNGRTLNGTLLSQRAAGAEHLFGIRRRQPTRNYTYEWLGQALGTDDASGECEANITDADPFDDGLLLIPNPPLCGAPLLAFNFVRYAADNEGFSHDYSEHPLYVNTWIDLDQDGIWSPGEKFVDATMTPVAPTAPNETRLDYAFGSVVLPRQPGKSNPWWIRTRLDWGEDVGDAANIDGTLNQTKGAAQHGEVEDYPITCRNPIRQQAPKRNAGQSASQVSQMVGGDSDANVVFVARVDEGDCVTQTVANPPVITYSPVDDETRVDYPIDGGIEPGQRVHTGLHQLDAGSAGSTLRSFFVLPAASGEGIPASEFIPTTHSALTPRDIGAGPQLTLTVGVLPASVGGVIEEDLLNPGQWLDSLTASVLVRIPAAPVPLDSLSPCNPAIGTLPAFSIPARVVTPSRPIRVVLPPAYYGSTVVLEIRSTWSVSPHENLEILEFTELDGGTVGVDPAPGALRTTAALWSFPNPSPAGTAIRFALARRSPVTLAVFDVRGAMVRELRREGSLEPGVHSAQWDGRDAAGRRVAPGTYFLVLTAASERIASKTLQLR